MRRLSDSRIATAIMYPRIAIGSAGGPLNANRAEDIVANEGGSER